MRLDWLGGSLGDLIARKKYARAIDFLQAQLKERQPSVQTRLQLADLLIQAGRGPEAVPLLIGLADELAEDGFFAKAIAILKRVEKIGPAELSLEPRLAALVERQRASGQRVTLPPTATQALPVARPVPEIGIEEIGPDTWKRMYVLPQERVVDEKDEKKDATPPVEGPSPLAVEELPSPPVEEPSPLAVEVQSPPPVEEPSALAVEVLPPPPVEEPATLAVEELSPPPVEEASTPGGAQTQAVQGMVQRFLSSLPVPVEPPSEELAPEELELVEAGEEADLELTAENLGLTEDDKALEVKALDLGLEALRAEPPAAREASDRTQLDLGLEALPAEPPPAASPEPLPAPARQLAGIPLFWELGEEEILAVVNGLRLATFDPGDIMVTQGEPGGSLFVLTHGTARVFARTVEGRSLAVAELGEGEFFGEISSLSGRPRTATVTAASWCEALVLDKEAVDKIARAHPRVHDVLERFYVERLSSPEAAAVRAVSLGDARTHEAAEAALRAHFGAEGKGPFRRLKLADALIAAGKHDAATKVLAALADDLARDRQPAKAIALLKLIERIASRHVEQLPLAPLARGERKPAPRPRESEDRLERWLVQVVREALRLREGPEEGAGPGALPRYAGGLRASPLFESFSEDELLALVRGIRLVAFEPGDIVVTEGETSEGLFVLATGAVKVFGRDPSGGSRLLTELAEGAFFGEVSTLAPRPRTATVTAARPTELLELPRPMLEGLVQTHPRVRDVLEHFFTERTGQAPPPS